MSTKQTHPLDQLAAKWPSAFVARHQIFNFTGGLISNGTVANLDSLGQGPPGRVKVGRNTDYPVSCFIEWLKTRSKSLEKANRQNERTTRLCE